ncbi:MAG: amidophosphoribosyltransferase [Oscillospiraceae bacterium]|jgi:amidophosphoribosyltransferase|nr:amidophosphoribosyltransferase [Oscillospiraceae bacterium]
MNNSGVTVSAANNRKLGEECGVFGIFKSDVLNTSKTVYYALYALQHRGQESCGISISSRKEKSVYCYKDLGLVSEVFNKLTLSQLEGDMAIGHVRYSTTGANTRENAQPLTIKYVKGTLSIAHNGNISNAAELRSELECQGAIFQSTNDTEVIAFLLARERLHSASIDEALRKVLPKLKGSFALLVMSPQKLLAARDPYGFRPLCIGKKDGAYMFASESCALDAVGAEFIRDVRPGEIVCVRESGLESFTEHCREDSALCVFEHIYFARPDSVIDGQSVYLARKEAGKLLAKACPADADIVFGVPDSGLAAAVGYAEQSGLPYVDGLMKNRYIGRTFIQPEQDMREESVSIKLNVLTCNVKGKRVVMVDDSIVRGTNILKIVTMMKNAGAAEVHVRISCPEFLWPCYFGTDVPDREHLASVINTRDELVAKIGADSLGFLPLDMVHSIAKDSTLKFCDACFSGKYPIDVPVSREKLEFEIHK